jgi:ketol-acid reductoisomerase
VHLNQRKIAVLGYGNQGRAHALNLRDSGCQVVVGSRPGTGYEAALKDGFQPKPLQEAAQESQVLLFLLPDLVIPEVYQELSSLFSEGQREVGFCHGYAYHFGGIQIFSKTGYFLVGPKGAGVVLRQAYQTGKPLPGVFAVVSPRPETRELALAYAKAVGLSSQALIETTFQEETECDLFGEQVVLCGGILELMESAFQVLIEKGHTPEMAFFECCYEAKMILDVWMQQGPSGLSQKISPTAFFGGLTRGRRLIDQNTREKMRAMFDEIRTGQFSAEWKEEAQRGFPILEKRLQEQKNSRLQKTYDHLKGSW